MHIRPHLDYCDMIYHIPIKTKEMSDGDSQRNLNHLMGTLESTQYQAALAVSGAWKGTSQDKIYNELGWETLDERRMFRRLVQFFKIMTNRTPDYLRLPTQSQHCHLYGVRFGNVLKDIECESYRYRNSFFPDSVSMWNDLGPNLRESVSISSFKDTLLKLYRPVKKSIFNVYDCGIKWIFQLRVGLSPLKSHKKKHNFSGYEEYLSDTCNCLTGLETTCHFLLHCPKYIVHRRILFGIVNPILRAYNIPFLVDELFVHLLLYGDVTFKFEENQNILKATINFIRNTTRFSQM